MLYRRQHSPAGRPGAAVVEMAAVALLFFALLFGLTEYCRFLFIRQVIDNASREGARYAAVRTITDGLEDDTRAVVLKRMAGVQNGVDDFETTLYRADETGQKTGAAEGAEFGEFVVVQIDCDYVPILPSLLFMGNKIHMTARTMINSEAN